MGVSVHIVGVRDLDIRFTPMMKVVRACRDAGIAPPQAVFDYFQSSGAEEFGYIGTPEDLLGYSNDSLIRFMAEAKIEYDGDPKYGVGATIDLSKIPKDVKWLRVYME